MEKIKFSYLAVIFLLIATSCRQAAKDSRPNIILILADDMGYSDLGCTGGEIPTPNIDWLAHNGLFMPNFYNAARCCPTRASLMTGLYPHQAGMGDMVEGRLLSDSTFLPAYQGWLGKDAVTIAEVLREGGYRTYLSGKWHLGNEEIHWPDNRGFEKTFAMIHGAGNYFNNDPWIFEDQFLRLHLNGIPFEPDKGFYLTDAITNFALEFIQEEKNDESPFFLYLSYTAPHWPLHAKETDIKKFQGQYMEGWESIRMNRFEKMKDLGILPNEAKLTPAFFNERKPLLTPSWDSLSKKEKSIWDRRMAVYAAQMSAMDQGIGKLIDYLREQGQLNNTLIMFLSDNGATDAAIYGATSWVADRSGSIGSATSFDSYGGKWANVSNTPYQLFKHFTSEGGIKTPFIAHFPNQIEPHQQSNSYAHVKDIMATCLDIAGIPYPQTYHSNVIKPLEGNSLSPVFSGQSMEAAPLFWEHQGNFAVRKGKWKLLNIVKAKDPEGDRFQLFDLEKDPAETIDLSEQYPEKKVELLNLYHQWANEVGVEPFDSLILARSL